jgi:hypothetical protein
MRATPGTPATGDVACESNTAASKAARSVRSRMLKAFHDQEQVGPCGKDAQPSRGWLGK